MSCDDQNDIFPYSPNVQETSFYSVSAQPLAQYRDIPSITEM